MGYTRVVELYYLHISDRYHAKQIDKEKYLNLIDKLLQWQNVGYERRIY